VASEGVDETLEVRIGDCERGKKPLPLGSTRCAEFLKELFALAGGLLWRQAPPGPCACAVLGLRVSDASVLFVGAVVDGVTRPHEAAFKATSTLACLFLRSPCRKS